MKFTVKEKKIKASRLLSREKSNSDGEKAGYANRHERSSSPFSKSKDNSSFFGSRTNEGDHSCLFCGYGNHDSMKCKKTLSNEERLEMVQKAGACSKCLKKSHAASKCRNKTVCK